MFSKIVLLSLCFLSQMSFSAESSNRDKSIGSISWRMIGLYEYLATGGHLNLNLGGFNTIELGHSVARSCIGSGRCQFNIFYYEALWRHFLGNSFNFRLGATARRKRINYQQRSVDGDHFDIRVSQTMVGPSLSIGNMWQLNHTVVAVDWIGLYVPMSQIGNRDVEGDTTGIDTNRLTDVYNDADKVNKWEGLLVLNFSLGVAF